MKSFILLFLLAISFQLIGQGVSSSQKTLVTKRTATWCPICGDWGWDMAQGLADLDLEGIVLIKAHYSGDLESQVSADITNNWNGAYQPEFFINEKKQEVGSTTWSSKIQEFASAINENTKKDPRVGFDINSSISGNTITADVNLEFLEAVSGSYYLGIYLVEDSIKNSQSGRGSNAIHDGVLRAEFSGSSFGSLIASNETAKGTAVNLTHALEVDEIDNRFLKVLAIVWKKDGELYKVENLHEAEAGLSSAVKTEEIVESDLNAVSVGGELELTFSMKESYSSGRIEVFHMDGRKIVSRDFHPNLNYNFISIPMAESRGNFIVVTVIGDDKLVASKKVFLK